MSLNRDGDQLANARQRFDTGAFDTDSTPLRIAKVATVDAWLAGFPFSSFRFLFSFSGEIRRAPETERHQTGHRIQLRCNNLTL